MNDQGVAQTTAFRVEEATIDDLHRAIKAGEATCTSVVRQYRDRVRAYTGGASLLVTADGAPVPEANGAIRAMAPLRFPTRTVKASACVLTAAGPGTGARKRA